MPAPGALTIHELLSPDVVRVDAHVDTKEEAIEKVVRLLQGDPAVRDLDQVLADVLAREQTMSTGVGKELALPHARTAAVTDTRAALVTTLQGVPFGAIDGKPVRLVFLLVGPEDERGRHIKLLSRVSRLMNREDFRRRLLQAQGVDEVLGLFRDAESSLA